MCASGEKLLICHNLSGSAGGTDISRRTDNACELGFYLLFLLGIRLAISWPQLSSLLSPTLPGSG